MLFRSDRKSTRLNSSHTIISYAVFCLKKNRRTSSLFSRAAALSLFLPVAALLARGRGGGLCVLREGAGGVHPREFARAVCFFLSPRHRRKIPPFPARPPFS